MHFKSKWFWICAALTVCVAIFLGFVAYQAKQPQEVIRVYKVTRSVRPVRPQFSAPMPILPTDDDAAEIDTNVNTSGEDFSDDASYNSDEFTDNFDELFADEQRHPNAADAPAPVSDADAQAGYVAQQLEELRMEIPQRLVERLELLDFVEEHAEVTWEDDEEIYLLTRQAYEETHELRRAIFNLSRQYLRYSDGDFSPFKPGGEFYNLLEQNHMGVQEAVRW